MNTLLTAYNEIKVDDVCLLKPEAVGKSQEKKQYKVIKVDSWFTKDGPEVNGVKFPIVRLTMHDDSIFVGWGNNKIDKIVVD